MTPISIRKATIALTLIAAGAAGCTPGQGRPAPQPGTGRPTTPAATSPAPQPALQLGPYGVGPLTLGMTKPEAVATGLTMSVNTATAGTCGGEGDGYLSVAGTDGAGSLVFSSATSRLVAIYVGVANPVRTPQGIGLGSTYAEVHAAYPTWRAIGPDPAFGHGSVPAPGNGQAHYRINIGQGSVVEISLDSNTQDCYE